MIRELCIAAAIAGTAVNLTPAAVADPQPRRSAGPVEPIRAGDRHPADVGKRRAQPPRPVVGKQVLVTDLHPGALGCDAKRSRRELVGGIKTELEALHGPFTLRNRSVREEQRRDESRPFDPRT